MLDGRLAVSTGLPSERDLATGMKLSRTTVAAAYALLRDEGWLDSRRGSGSRLRLPDAADGAATNGPVGVFGAFEPGGSADIIDLTTASLPAPTAALTAAITSAARTLAGYTPHDGYHPFGLPALRESVAQRYVAAGVPTSADEILVTNGAQHAFTIALQELSSPGDRVMIECPTYPVALDAIRATRRIPGPVGVSSGGVDGQILSGAWDLDLIAAELRQTAPRIAYLIPDFQNPTGAVMTAQERERLVTMAGRAGTVLLIDESFRDVPFPGSAALPPPMSAFGDGTRVLALGSVSKSFWGGLRVGWIRAAPALIRRLAAARALGDMAGPVLDQLVVTELLADPHPALDQQRARLAAGADALHRTLAEHLPDWQPTRPAGGGSLWVRLPGPYATELARVAPAAGVRIAPGPRFGPDGTMESYLRLPFTSPVENLLAAGPRLAVAAAQAMRHAPSSLPGWLT